MENTDDLYKVPACVWSSFASQTQQYSQETASASKNNTAGATTLTT